MTKFVIDTGQQTKLACLQPSQEDLMVMAGRSLVQTLPVVTVHNTRITSRKMFQGSCTTSKAERVTSSPRGSVKVAQV